MLTSYSMRDLEFSYSNSPVLTINALDIPVSKIIALVGPNGAGKTTLLHLLDFLVNPQRGLLSFLGTRVSNSNVLDLRRRVGLLPQNPYLFRCSVLENVAIGLKLRGFPCREAKKKAQESLKKVGMQGYENRSPSSLSGGEAQRVALARTLILNPDVFLFDEPGNHLDLESVKRTEQMILDLNHNDNKTVIFTTHQIGFAQNLTDLVVHIFQGKVIPNAPYNLFRGRLTNGHQCFDTGAIQFDISKMAGQGSFLLIDPTMISFSTSEEFLNLPNVFHGKIVSQKLMNNIVITEVNAGEKFEIHSPLKYVSNNAMIGAEIWLHIGLDAMKLV
ncbi:MAG: energy-coupling factor ABC transporter ATP-binding protein [Desulfomonilaceae bacterium]